MMAALKQLIVVNFTYTLRECGILRSSSTYYAVGRGKEPGIYKSWTECETQIKGFPQAKFKKCFSFTEAENFVNIWKNYASSDKGGVVSFRPKETTDKLTCSKSEKEKTEEKKPKCSKNQLLSCDSSGKAKPLTQIDENVRDSPDKNSKKEISFKLDENDFVEVYTDGSASPTWGTGSKAGLGVWFGVDHPLNVSKSMAGVTTNNAAEIMAALTAVQVAKEAGIKKLKILTDSEYLLNVATRWIHVWKRRGWITETGQPVKLQKEIKKLINESSALEVRWEKVRGHSGVEGNESAHGLAVNGALKKKYYP